MKLNAQQLAEARAQIERIQSVDRAHVRTDVGGTVIGVDLISDTSRAAQRVVRDVEVVLRGYDVDLDHRKISVAQLEDPQQLHPRVEELRDLQREGSGADQAESPHAGLAPPALARDVMDGSEAVLEVVDESERLRPVAVHSTTRGGSFAVEVEMVYANLEGAPGRAEGPAADPAGCLHLVGEATLGAVRNLLEPGYEAQLREIRRIAIGGHTAVVAAVDFGDGRRLDRYLGSCPNRGALYDAAVYAVLDALNRPLGRARFRMLALLENDEADERQARATGA
jgi:hypothetical protein